MRSHGCAVRFGAVLLMAMMLLAGCSAERTEQPAFWAAEAEVLDRDGTDGYSGDFVLIYNPSDASGKRSIGAMEGLAGGAESFPASGGAEPFPVNAGLYAEPDPYVKNEVRLEEKEAGWTVGDRKVFDVKDVGEIAFAVAAEGARCRVWVPLNPAAPWMRRTARLWPDM